jgi:ABC-type lipoprotein release transport system permease subunit
VIAYLFVLVVIKGVALLASGIPVWRAAHLDSASTLRAV